MASLSPIPLSQRPGLLSLPIEMLENIGAATSSVHDLRALCFSSRALSISLLAMLATVESKDTQPRTLLRAAAHGNMVQLEEALKAGIDVDGEFTRLFSLRQGKDLGFTPILTAAREGHRDIVLRLLDAGADPRGLDEAGFNALHCAAREGHEEIVKILLQRFPDLIYDIAEGAGPPAVYAACKKPIFRLLLNAMHPAMCASSLAAAAYFGYYDIFKWLIERGVIIRHSRRLLAKTLRACNEGHIEIARFLLKAGAPVAFTEDGHHEEALFICCSSNGPRVIEMAKLLLEHGADPVMIASTTSMYNDTPLSRACKTGNIDLIKLLLARQEHHSAGYEPKTITGMQKGACESSSIACFKFILARFPLEDPSSVPALEILNTVSSRGTKEMAQVLLNLGVANGLDRTQLPLAAAWSHGNIEVIKLLFEAGKAFNARVFCNLPAIWPIMAEQGENWEEEELWTKGDEANQIACLQLMLEFGMDNRVMGWTNRTLVAACFHGAVGCVRLLLDKCNADPGGQTSSGMKPVHAAVRSGKLELVKLLVERGASLHATWGYDHRTTIQDAWGLENPDEMIDFLVSQKVDTTPPFLVSESTPTLIHLSRSTSSPRESHLIFHGAPGGGFWDDGPRRIYTKTLYDLFKYPTPLRLLSLGLACERGYFDTAKWFLAHGVKPEGNIPLFNAVRVGRLDIVKLLVAHGATAEIPSIVLKRASPKKGRPLPSAGIMRFLVKSGADIKTALKPLCSPEWDSSSSNKRAARLEVAKAFARIRSRRALSFVIEQGGLRGALSRQEWQMVLAEAIRWRSSNLIRIILEEGLAVFNILDLEWRDRWEKRFWTKSEAGYSDQAYDEIAYTIETLEHLVPEDQRGNSIDGPYHSTGKRKMEDSRHQTTAKGRGWGHRR